jgi:hypothetical protein
MDGRWEEPAVSLSSDSIMVTATCRPLRTALVILGCIALLVGLLPPAPASAVNDPSAALDFACRVNAERATQGRQSLRVASDLTQVAEQHSVRMADRNHLHHNPNLSTDVKGWTRISENVGRGASVSSIHTALMNSSGHRANILDTGVTEMGIGVERRGTTVWVTQVFRRPTSSTSAPLPKCRTPAPTDPEPATSAPSINYPVSGDWNGDGRTTQGRFRDGEWRLRDTAGNTTVVKYGRAGDLPIVGDWNGNGRASLGIVRDGEWHLKNDLSTGGADVRFTYGRVTRGDVPIAGDWNGNGRDGIGIIRDGEWHLRNTLSGGGSQIAFTYGRITRGDVPLIGDWNGNGRDTVGIVRDGEWHLRNTLSGGSGQVIFTYGRVLSGDKPVIGDWNRDGRSGISIVRGTDWHIRNSLSGGSAEQVIRY